MIAKGTQRERELGAITFDAQRKALPVKGMEEEKQAAIALINAEAQLKKQELQAKFDEEDRAQRQQHLVDLLADEDAAEVEREAQFQIKLQDALLNQQQYDQVIYNANRASLEAKLALEEQYGSNTSKLYRAT